MMSPTRTLFRWWGPCLGACLAPLALAWAEPNLARSAGGWLVLAASAGLASFGAAAVLSRSLSEAVERVSADMEAAAKPGAPRGRDWGLLRDLAGSFDFTVSELRSKLGLAEREAFSDRTRLGSAQAGQAQAKEEFFRALAHDLRSPVFGVRGSARMIERNLGTSPRDLAFIASIYRSCDRLDLIIEHVQDLARLEGGPAALAKAPFSASDWIARTAAAAAGAAKEKGVEIEAAPLPRDLGTLRGEEPLLARALASMLEEALRLSPKEGKIGLEAVRTSGRELEVSVLHRGPVAEGDAFESFQRVDPLESAALYGLGLALAGRAASAHGGRAWSEARPGGGGRLVLRLPVS